MNDLNQALGLLFAPASFLLMVLGTSLGIIIGAIPGLTGAMLITLTLPLTYHMTGADAMILLVSMYVGSISGGLITATLLRMPGTPASIMTTLDGYPMAQGGKPGRALGLGITASFVGGLISWIFLISLARPLAEFSTRLGPFEYFSLVLVALVMIASVSGNSLTRGLLAGLLGIFCSMPGTSPATGQVRWTLGLAELQGGLELLPVLIGLFAVGQIIEDVLGIDQRVGRVKWGRDRMFMKLSEWKSQAVNLIRSSVIGTWIGILPGIGANIGSVVAYSAARRFSRTPERFGHGSEEGIVASEAANNATVGGALIPLISLGIPGSVIDAILLGALVIHGLQPGPLLFQERPDIVYTMIFTMLLANVFMYLFMVSTVRWCARVMSVPRWFLVPTVLTLCVIGSHALNNRMFDVWVMIAFGLLGTAMTRARIPLPPFVIGFILAPIAETKLSEGLMASRGSYLPILTQPIAAVFFGIAVFLLVLPVVQRWREWKGGNARRESHGRDPSGTDIGG